MYWRRGKVLCYVVKKCSEEVGRCFGGVKKCTGEEERFSAM